MFCQVWFRLLTLLFSQHIHAHRPVNVSSRPATFFLQASFACFFLFSPFLLSSSLTLLFTFPSISCSMLLPSSAFLFLWFYFSSSSVFPFVGMGRCTSWSYLFYASFWIAISTLYAKFKWLCMICFAFRTNPCPSIVHTLALRHMPLGHLTVSVFLIFGICTPLDVSSPLSYPPSALSFC